MPKYLLLAADEMETGLRSYRQAALSASADKRKGAFREVLLAEQLQRMMRSDEAILEFEDLRLRLEKAADPTSRTRILDRMSVILKEELARTLGAAYIDCVFPFYCRWARWRSSMNSPCWESPTILSCCRISLALASSSTCSLTNHWRKTPLA